VTTYRIFIIVAVAAAVAVGAVTIFSLSKGILATEPYSIDVDPFKDPQNLFVTARVMIQNTGAKPLTNVKVDFGSGHGLAIDVLDPGQKVILSPPEGNSLQLVTVTADNGISVTKEYRIPPKMPGMMGS
jgi:hypothetical protein